MLCSLIFNTFQKCFSKAKKISVIYFQSPLGWKGELERAAEESVNKSK